MTDKERDAIETWRIAVRACVEEQALLSAAMQSASVAMAAFGEAFRPDPRVPLLRQIRVQRLR